MINKQEIIILNCSFIWKKCMTIDEATEWRSDGVCPTWNPERETDECFTQITQMHADETIEWQLNDYRVTKSYPSFSGFVLFCIAQKSTKKR